MKIKKGDNVIVIAGKDRGKQGKVARVLPAENKLIVEGINMQKKREKARRQGKKGQTLTKAAPVQASNVMIYCASCGRGGRIGTKFSGKSKIRVCKKCGKEF